MEVELQGLKGSAGEEITEIAEESSRIHPKGEGAPEKSDGKPGCTGSEAVKRKPDVGRAGRSAGDKDTGSRKIFVEVPVSRRNRSRRMSRRMMNREREVRSIGHSIRIS